jgi:hypothetical protein
VASAGVQANEAGAVGEAAGIILERNWKMDDKLRQEIKEELNRAMRELDKPEPNLEDVASFLENAVEIIDDELNKTS